MFLQQCPELVIFFDTDLNCVLHSQSLCTFLRLSVETNLVGSSLLQLCKLASMSDEQAGKFVIACKSVMESKEALVIQGDGTIVQKDHNYRYLIVPMFDDGNCMGVMTFQQDISDLIAAQKAAEESARIKGDFLARVMPSREVKI